ncbi:MAG: phosphogluconate dehydratase [Pseudomonadales bacterium]|jgi:phosphogluconate dehydratase|nr:phosphogluconate dehydratase [Pseudomonadales bacterium]MCK5792759.1 phosphogluconate dehydratase [Ketobacter sp.]TNC90986.1 MAG: phosphogluconate dehydratase [Alcanivorax sp.]HAG95405.1 phosphogluconate dehydratase [Gammaproteobacteria bacterium]HAU15663.1 phosphogluconate dehydratase [Gammaproteobacteria bacterium]
MTHRVLQSVLDQLTQRSQSTRQAYLAMCDDMQTNAPQRSQISCTNLAHSYAAASNDEKQLLRQTQATPNLAIVTAYNDMLSAHQPYYRYPEAIKHYALKQGATAQVAGGTPAMCDGVTQGQPGMELSLFSRDVIALSTAVALSHNTFDAGLYLGICDKIVPGLLIGALSFGHLPGLFIPSGPMHSGISNDEKGKVRVAYAEGKVNEEALLRSEEKSYHSEGTCTFYGTANSNQMLLEIMGLQLPGSAFVPPNTDLRHTLTEAAVKATIKSTLQQRTGLGYILDAANLLNGVIGLLATGGSTNHTLHLVAIGRACGWQLTWDDIAALSEVIPLLTRLYPNGSADVNAFHANGGTPAVIDALWREELLFTDIETAYGETFDHARLFPLLEPDNTLGWQQSSDIEKDDAVMKPAHHPFKPTGGVKLLRGNLGEAIIKVSSLDESKAQNVTAPAIVFESQIDIMEQFKKGQLNKDFIAVLPGQGPAANGMPELHKLTPPLTSLQNQGFRVALVTDGRMSGASGKFPAAIHLTPEAVKGGPIGKIQTGDIIRLDWSNDQLVLEVDSATLDKRPQYCAQHETPSLGRALFKNARKNSSPANQGASFIL